MNDEWAHSTLEAECEVRMGMQLSPDRRRGIRPRAYLRAANVKPGFIDLDDLNEMDFTSEEEDRLVTHAGDVLLVEGGNEKSLGSPALVGEREQGLPIQNTLIRLRVKDQSRLLPGFLYWSMRWRFDQGTFSALGKGTTILHLGAQRVAPMPMAIPPLRVQRRIVDVMEHLDTHIANLEREVLRAQRHQRLLLTRMLDAPEPKNEVAIGDMARLARQRIDPSKIQMSEVIHYSIPALDSTDEPVVESPTTIKSQKFLVEEDAVLVSLLNPRIPRAWLAKGGPNALCSTEFAALTPIAGELLLGYLYWFTKSDAFWTQMQERAIGTTGSRQRVKASALTSLLISPPNPARQQQLVNVMDHHQAAVLAIQAEIHAMHALRKDLIGALIAAKHDIPASYDVLLGSV